MTDTLDFVKNLWGSMGVPGLNIPNIATPSLSVDELDKKINDLKAVESWLNLNMSMLRGSIQALEVQRGTIVTLKSMGASFAAAVKQAPGAGDKAAEAAPHAAAFFQQSEAAPAADSGAAAPEAAAGASQMGNPTAWWNMLQDQFKQAVTSAMASDAVAGAAAMASDTAAKFAAAAKPAEAAAAAKPRVPAKKAAAKPAAAKAKPPRGQA